MRRYLVRKLIIYILTFFVAATIDWILPRLVSGNPISILLSKMSLEPGTYNAKVTELDKAMKDPFLAAISCSCIERKRS